MSFDKEKFLNLLNENHTFPCPYTFKFIVKAECKEQLLVLLTDHQVQEKTSRKGNYISVTSSYFVHSCEQVLAIYQRVSKVEGVITL